MTKLWDRKQTTITHLLQTPCNTLDKIGQKVGCSNKLVRQYGINYLNLDCGERRKKCTYLSYIQKYKKNIKYYSLLKEKCEQYGKKLDKPLFPDIASKRLRAEYYPNLCRIDNHNCYIQTARPCNTTQMGWMINLNPSNRMMPRQIDFYLFRYEQDFFIIPASLKRDLIFFKQHRSPEYQEKRPGFIDWWQYYGAWHLLT